MESQTSVIECNSYSSRQRALSAICDDRESWALFLDIDGTLIDIADRPENVVVPDGLVTTVGRLREHMGGALALITGRMISSADKLFAPLDLVSSGVHGAEMRYAMRGPIVHLAEPLSNEIVHSVESIASSMPGIRVERKGAGLTVHYRRAPEYIGLLERELRALVAVQPMPVNMEHGRSVFEIGPAQLSKATALKSMGRMEPFSGRRPVMIGDDAGDQTALEAAKRQGGFGTQSGGRTFLGRRG